MYLSHLPLSNTNQQRKKYFLDLFNVQKWFIKICHIKEDRDNVFKNQIIFLLFFNIDQSPKALIFIYFLNWNRNSMALCLPFARPLVELKGIRKLQVLIDILKYFFVLTDICLHCTGYVGVFYKHPAIKTGKMGCLCVNLCVSGWGVNRLKLACRSAATWKRM